MKKMILGLCLFILYVPEAMAQNSRAVCEFLPVREHFLGADYVPGVDVRGNPVVPADVRARANSFVDVIKIPVTLDLAQQVNGRLPSGLALEAGVGVLEIHKDSRVLYNGEELSGPVYAYCGKEPFNIEATLREPEPVKSPPPAVPETKPEQEEIIWGEAY